MTNIHHHLVLSPKDLLPLPPITEWLKGNAKNYILSLEHGTNGHPHYDCYFELFKPKRSDSLKRSILRLYEIPKDEQKNVKICQNNIDPNPYYGYGYSLKEGNVMLTTFDSFQHADFLEYYENACERVKEIQKDKRPKQFTLDDLAEECVTYISNYYENRQLKDEPTAWLITEYLKSIKQKLKFSVYQKINQEKLSEFISIKLVGALLDCPPPQTPPLIYSTKLNNPLINLT